MLDRKSQQKIKLNVVKMEMLQRMSGVSWFIKPLCK